MNVLAFRRGTVASMVLLSLCSVGRAAKYSWNVAVGDWSVAANWTGAVPGSNDYAYVVNGGTAAITSNVECAELDLGSSVGNGTVLMSGGSLSTYLLVGSGSGGSGMFVLSNSAYLSSSPMVGYSGTGVFNLSGGTHNVIAELYLGYNSGASGTYNLGGSGQLFAGTIYVGHNGTGVFNQTGGTNAVDNSFGGGQNGIIVGYGAGSSGAYRLSGSGVTWVLQDEYVGYNPGSSGSFQQSSGSNSTDGLFIGSSGSYTLSGGTLQVRAAVGVGSVYGDLDTGALVNNGVFDGSNSPATLMISNCTLDLTSGTWRNLGLTSVVMGTNSFTIVPAGFDTSTGFAKYSSLGLTHTAGTTLTVPLGSKISGSFTLNDPVICQGSILPVFDDYTNNAKAIYLNGGLNLSGIAYLGNGRLTINNSSSSITGGYLQTSLAIVGSGGVGAFTQSAGTVQLIYGTQSGTLIVGDQVSDSGAYTLAGGVIMTTQAFNAGSGSEYLGYSGSGSLTQTGGINNCSQIWLGVGPESNGAYSLSNGTLWAQNEIVGLNGAGTFTQSGGTNTVAVALSLGGGTSHISTYNLSGGLLILPSLIQGSTSSMFYFTGGTLHASSGFTTTATMTFGNGGNATFDTLGVTMTNDTAGRAVTLSGALSGQGNLTKVGSGPLLLAATNTYTGKTLIGGGTLGLLNPLAMQGSTFDTSGSGTLSFGPLTAATLGGLTGPGALTLANSASAALALSVGNNNASTTYTGVLKGPGSLIKIGSGTLILSGSNTYLGGTTVLDGTLVVTSAAAIENGTSVTVGNAGAFPAPVVPTSTASSAPAASAVPEPGTLALLSVALCGAAVYQRMRSRWNKQ